MQCNDHLWKGDFVIVMYREGEKSLCVFVFVCVCVCVCIYMCVCVYYVCVCMCESARENVCKNEI